MAQKNSTPPFPIQTAVFGGGCFWCTEAIFSRLQGVISVTSGYAGGKDENPSYFRVSEGWTGHAEVVKIEFDPAVITYSQLVEIFFDTHDPTTPNQQGADVGTQYRSIILFTSEDQKKAAEEIKQKLQESRTYTRSIITEIHKLSDFYTAEEYHQKYFDRYASEPYCQVVIAPKLEKFEKKYAHLLKKN